ncbi:hypothetical protein DRH29_03875 [candidate division Kazan bacterium]|uniref:Uncharacterized protein n=1 Tax=candidate division Kazan bacterium TaxID=2202143 RepID=A0A420ZC13_UNCK3|nr:MAG: hypothetical protein DRH29_03875 [candidate division Kazan bacterium]
MVTLNYQTVLNAIGGLLFKISETRYEYIYPKQLDNGTTKMIVRELGKRIIDFGTSPPTIGSETTIDIATPSGLNNPIAFFRGKLGYDFDNDAILMFVGEWDGSSNVPRSTTVKLLSIARDFSDVTVEIDDVLSLVKNAASDVDLIKLYAHAWRLGNLGVATIGAYAAGSERSVILKDTGTGWSAEVHSERYNYVQELVEPFWDENTFMGFLTEGHGTNSLWIKTDGSVQAGAPGGTFTTSPIYDPINNRILWFEWGGEISSGTQHIWTAPPSTPFTGTDITPSGSLTDAEGNTVNLQACGKIPGFIFSDKQNNKVILGINFGGLPAGVWRVLQLDLDTMSVDGLFTLKDGTDTIYTHVYLRAIDPSAKKLIPVPIVNVYDTALGWYV